MKQYYICKTTFGVEPQSQMQSKSISSGERGTFMSPLSFHFMSFMQTTHKKS